MIPFLKSILIEVPSGKESRYPFNIPAIKGGLELKLNSFITFLVGENGSGKSTFIEAIAIQLGLNPEGGNRYTVFNSLESESDLSEHTFISKGVKRIRDSFFFRAETAYSLFQEAERQKEFGGFGWAHRWSDMHKKSHGESLLEILKHRLKDGVYIFDEPETALSVQRQLEFLSYIHQLVCNGSQLIIATHSPIILSYPSSAIFELTEEGPIEMDYKSTMSYKTMKHFIDNVNYYQDRFTGNELGLDYDD